MIDPTVIWYVVFHPRKRWWARRFSHVSLAGFSNNTWLHLDLNRGGVTVSQIYHWEEVEEFLSFILTYCVVVKYGPASPGRQFFRPMTCVSWVKHVLGAKSGALRPDRLFRDLTEKQGCEIVYEGPENRGNPGAEATTGTRAT